MRGLTFHAAGDVRVDELPEPTIERPTDAVVRVELAGVCGSDLHIYNAGESFAFSPGSRLGHEFVGVVEAVGSDVVGFSVGDRVLSSVSVACGDCMRCVEGLSSSCVQWSLFGWAPRTWQHGGSPEGGQSQYVRVPLAATTLHAVPESLADPSRARTLLPLVDVMSTGWHGLTRSRVEPGQAVVVIGDGAVGLAAVHGAMAKGAEHIICLGHHPGRVATAAALGATATLASRDDEEIAELVREETGGDGAHAVIDTISSAASMTTAHACVRPGGVIACLGMDHFTGSAPALNWFDQFVRNISVTGGLVPGKAYFEELLSLTERGVIDPSPMISHELALDEAPRAYRLMAERAEGVTKVALRPNG